MKHTFKLALLSMVIFVTNQIESAAQMRRAITSPSSALTAGRQLMGMAGKSYTPVAVATQRRFLSDEFDSNFIPSIKPFKDRSEKLRTFLYGLEEYASYGEWHNAQVKVLDQKLKVREYSFVLPNLNVYTVLLKGKPYLDILPIATITYGLLSDHSIITSLIGVSAALLTENKISKYYFTMLHKKRSRYVDDFECFKALEKKLSATHPLNTADDVLNAADLRCLRTLSPAAQHFIEEKKRNLGHL